MKRWVHAHWVIHRNTWVFNCEFGVSVASPLCKFAAHMDWNNVANYSRNWNYKGRSFIILGRAWCDFTVHFFGHRLSDFFGVPLIFFVLHHAPPRWLKVGSLVQIRSWTWAWSTNRCANTLQPILRLRMIHIPILLEALLTFACWPI